MTVEELALQLGVTPKEAMALCLVAGVKVKGPAQRLSARDVEKVQAVLTGQSRMLDAERLSGKAPLGTRTPTRSAGFPLAVLIAIGIAVVIGLVAWLGSNLRGDTSINVAAGDCFDADLLFGTVFGSGIDRKPCDQADYRAFAVLELDPIFDEWPGRDAIEERAEARCVAIAPSALESDDGVGVGIVPIYYFGPGDEAAWENPAARKIVCAEPT